MASWWLVMRFLLILNRQEGNLKVWLLIKSKYHIVPNPSTTLVQKSKYLQPKYLHLQNLSEMQCFQDMKRISYF